MDYTDPLSLNLYTYCYNNPITMIDPSGHAPDWLENIWARAKLNAITRLQYPWVFAANVNWTTMKIINDRINNSISKVENNKSFINNAGKEFGVPAKIIGSIILKEQYTQSIPDEIAIADGLIRGATHSVGLGAIFPSTAREAWNSVNPDEAANLPSSNVDLQNKLYLDNNFNIRTIAVVLVHYAKQIYGNNIDISSLTIEQWKVVVWRYNATDKNKADNYSDKVYEYLDSVDELLD